ncbi:hypothetical protein C8R41DRAFT_980080 [Lentinula lateritia]|uniref:Protein kinase domain-containing protein n=1 Tax=Lentinula lateritia TaxID=40482 RepID=A0ABQ8VLR5_9AGAR|nr:hypothetical protein C8R41DRAFT_980080 [Lentinula lateritia]
MSKLTIQNSIRKVVLHCDASQDTVRTTISIELKRVKLPNDLIRPRKRPTGAFAGYFLEEAPIRPPSALPPPGDLTLETNLSTFLGSGRTGIVYSLENAVLSDSTHFLPELVFKFARLHRCADLYREAWFYEEMECLQGVAIPRCYGLFEAEIPPGWMLKLIKLIILRSTRNKLCILVEERLGGHLSIGSPVSPELREDLNTLFEEIGHLGVLSENDIRYANILQAPACPPGLPSLVSPFTFRTHGWRMIDFEMAAKTQQTARALAIGHQEYLEYILDALEAGYVCDVGGSD